jgi:hypothetical protein
MRGPSLTYPVVAFFKVIPVEIMKFGNDVGRRLDTSRIGSETYLIMLWYSAGFIAGFMSSKGI